MNKEDFPILKTGIIYLDSGATTLKPNSFIETTTDYYTNYSANAHRGDYDISLEVDQKFEETRVAIANFINAKKVEEIIFTSGTTDGISKIVFGYFRHHLNRGDEVLLTKTEHASVALPWFELAKELGLIIKYIDLDSDYKVSIANLNKAITKDTKVISIAHVTNVIGDVRPLKDIIEVAHRHNILVLVDGAQSVPHLKVDVMDLDIDFLAFSAHKMLGPTGLGIIYGKEALLKKMYPTTFGGGMNTTFKSDGTKSYHDLPYLLEAGTQNIAGVIGFYESVKYINKIGINKIHEYEVELRKYTLDKLMTNNKIKIYNPNSESGIIIFNYEDIFAQDLAVYLNKYKICIRAGNHCAKMVEEVIDVKNTCRLSLYFYNTKEEIDYLIKVLDNPNIKEEII